MEREAQVRSQLSSILFLSLLPDVGLSLTPKHCYLSKLSPSIHVVVIFRRVYRHVLDSSSSDEQQCNMSDVYLT